MEPTQQPTDQQALALTHALALQESGHNGTPNYNAVGDAGTSKGAYQWQPGNFESAAKTAGLDPNDFSPENQDKVAYSEVKAYKDKGYDPGQIASLWNSGSPNNWQNHSGTTTINGKAISYDTPAYVKGVQKYYQQLTQQSQPGSNYNPTPFSNPGAVDFSGETQSATPTQSPVTLGSIGKGALGLLSSAEKPFIDLAAAPIQGLAKALGKPDPFQQGIGGGQAPAQVDPLASTAGGVAEQEAGNAAQVGSYFVPGGEGVVPAVAGGATMGLLQGAGNAMSNQDNLTDVATQGAEGATIGGGTAGVLGAAGGLLGKAGEALSGEGAQKALAGLKDAYTSALNLTAGERGMESATGKDLAKVLVDNGVPLARNDNSTLDASDAITQLQSKLNTLNDKADPLVATADAKGDLVSLPQILEQTQQDIRDMGLSASDTKAKLVSAENQMKDEIEANGTHVIPSVAEDIKQGLQATAFKKGRIPSDEAATQSDIAYALSKRMRSTLEDVVGSTDKGSEYANINAERSQLVDAVKRLTKLDGVRTVKGGRLGKMAGGLTGTIIGGSTGNPLAALAGDYFGGKAAEFLNNPATKIALAKAKVGASKAAPKLLGKVAKPTGKAVSGVGGLINKSAHSAGLLGNLILNSQNKS